MKRATNVAFIAPSVTTYQDVDKFNYVFNPSYRIYTLDGVYESSSYSTLSHKTMYLDLADANERNLTDWKIEYDTRSEYGLNSLLPSDFDELVDKMLKDLFSPLTEKFIK